MTIDEVYRFINYVANKEQRGNIKPSDFNLLVKNAQVEFVSKRLGNVKTLNDRAIPQFGYKINRKLLEDLRTLLVQSTQVVNSDGYMLYPADYFYIDSIYKEDFTEIEVVNSDEYPKIKKSQITPPTIDYPVAVPFNDKMLVDPLASEILNTNFEFNEGLTDWSQESTSSVPSLAALNLWTDSGLAGEYSPGITPNPPQVTVQAWSTGANPSLTLTGPEVSTILVTSFVLNAAPPYITVPAGLKYRIVFSFVNAGAGTGNSGALYLGFRKSGQFFNRFINISNFFGITNNPLDAVVEFDMIAESGIYEFDEFGIYVLQYDAPGGTNVSTFTLKSLTIQPLGSSPSDWISTEYGYVYYTALTGSDSSKLLYQQIDVQAGDTSIDFYIKYSGTVSIDIYELDLNNDVISVTTVEVVSNNVEVSVSRIIQNTAACRAIGIVSRTNDTIGGEVRLYNLRFQDPQLCKFNYIKYPTDPLWAYTETDGVPVYDPINSVQLSTPPHTHVEICMIALQSIGINLDAAQITQYANLKESTIG